MLTSRYAMWMGWGPELTFFYNDAYAPTLGVKQSWALGSPARKVWGEIWPDIGPRIDQVVRTGQATWDEGLQLFLERSGYTEETYHTFSYSPAFDDVGEVRGMVCVVTEETNRVIGERRLGALRNLAAELSSSKREAEVFAATERCLQSAHRDFPFALAYVCDEDQREATLVCRSGVEAGSPLAPQQIDCELREMPWPIARVIEDGEAIAVEELPMALAESARGPWSKGARQAMLLPLMQPGQPTPMGVFIAGANPFRPMDEAYRSFAGLFAGQLAAGITNAQAYETERRRAEALAEIDRAKTTFFSNVSHEFRTPLTLMLGPLADMLAQQNGSLPQRVSEELTMVHRNGLRLLKLVNTLLEFSRIEAGRIQASFVPTDLSALTAELASAFRSAMEKAGLEYRIETTALREAYVDRDMWEKIVLNLISNAFKFTLGGSIRVGLIEEGGKIRLTVQDTGSGIPASELPRLFERFHRVEGTKGRTHEGTGIGLALVQELARIHGGSVTVESELGTGSTFAVTIPAGKDHLPADRIGARGALISTAVGLNAFVEEAMRWLPGATSDEEVGGEAENGPNIFDTTRGASTTGAARARVLIADDNADMRDYLLRLLSERYEVVTAANGEEALRAARERAPALIVSDVMMPVMDGFALLKALRGDAGLAGVPVILLSARAGEEATLDGIRAGADDYLVKPFSARELNARVDALIERKRFERQLATAEQRLQSALAAAKMAAWEWDSASDAIVASETARDVFGLLPGEKISSGAFVLTLVNPDDREKYRKAREAAIKNGDGYRIEFRIIRPIDGKVAWLEDRSQVSQEPGARKKRLVGLVTVVTARKEAEVALRQSDDRSRFVVRLDDALRLLDDPDEVARTAARLLAEHFRCERALYVEVAEDEDHCTVTGEYSPGLPSIIGAYRISQYGADYIATVRANEPYVENDTTRGSMPRVEREQFAALEIGSFISAPLFKRGRLVAMFVVHNLTPRQWETEEIEEVSLVANRCWESMERARVTRALLASEERLAFSVEAGELGTFYCPMPLGPIMWNAKCKEHFWLPADADVNFDKFYSIVHEEDRERVREAVQRTVFGQEPYDIQYRTVAPDGRWRWVRAKGRAYYDASGNPTRFDGITLDITELKRTERRREETLAAERAAREEAERVSRMKDEFLATLSHELRTPLNAILGWSQILSRSGHDVDESKEGLEAIERNARAQTQIIEDLLDMSRIISGKVRLEMSRLSMPEVVTAAVQSVRPSAEVKGVRLVPVLDPFVGPVTGDANRLQQVVWNLLTNAIKFTPRGGQVQVLLERVDSHLELSVSDTGEGIAPEFVPHVFERFRQADASTTRKHGGLGLGLNIVKQLVELHGGAVRVKSEGIGKGSTFTITLPLAVARPQRKTGQDQQGRVGEREREEIHGEPPDLSGVTVLVVDDDADARNVMKRILGGGGASVITVGSAQEALEVMPRAKPSLLVSDIGMPGEDGYDLIRKIRAMPADDGGSTPAVALTAFARSEDRLRVLRAGYQIHVAKPVEPSELLTVCAILVGRVG
jgi:PAS domain S-box-containing protein